MNIKEKRRKIIPDPNEIFPCEYKNMCYIKNVVKASNIEIGDYTYYSDENDSVNFEKNNILFNYPEFGDKLIIGKFCSIAQGTKIIMGSANHRITSISTYPFNVFGGIWEEKTPSHLSQLPFKGDTIIGNDVWLGRESVIMPGVKIGDGAIIAAYSVVAKDVEPYTVVGGNPTRVLKKRFDDEFVNILLKLKWWNFDKERLIEFLPILCDEGIENVKLKLKKELKK
ncbi:virginiamycin A acetyltransferase [Fusobacterium sp. PH5-7]|uniref:CatB-related O-acetyltransferase n=1 Tax=Fusobacterium TaxID=848 RepID=UPI002475F368|nr:MULTISPECIES: CatB-related O-acetyltransferase [Fusobacterium]MDH6458341.1 virginiamycin A acetyltransferase [Fusobacterium sp. PH5-7]